MNADDQAEKYAIHAACREGQTQKALSLLESQPRLASLRDPDDRLPLHWAASYNNLEIIKQLSLDRKTFQVDATDGSGWTALMMACNIKDSEELVKFLLSKEADVNLKNDAGQTAVFFAASKANLDLVRLLVVEHHANVRVRDRRGQIALHRACAVGATGVVKCLVKEGKSPVNGSDQDGWTGLFHAVAEGWGDTAVEVLQAGAESGKKDREGKVALMYAPDDKVRGFILRQAELEGVDIVTTATAD